MSEYDQIQLTTNWRLGELLVSRDFPVVAASMKPDERHRGNLFLLSKLILQPTRSRFGVKQRVESGLRINGLNALVGGSTTSLHPEGLAADIRPHSVSDFHLLPEMFEFIRDELRGRWAELKYDSIKNFIHVGLWHFGKEPFCQMVMENNQVAGFQV
jgi:hypothetical protein